MQVDKVKAIIKGNCWILNSRISVAIDTSVDHLIRQKGAIVLASAGSQAGDKGCARCGRWRRYFGPDCGRDYVNADDCDVDFVGNAVARRG